MFEHSSTTSAIATSIGFAVSISLIIIGTIVIMLLYYKLFYNEKNSEMDSKANLLKEENENIKLKKGL